MSCIYPIAPYPVYVDPSLRVCAQAATPEQVKVIRAIGDNYLNIQGIPGQVGFHDYKRSDPSVRACLSVWLPAPQDAPEVRGMYDLIARTAQDANGHFWQFDIWGFQDRLHYVRYAPEDGPEGGKFDWHQDRGDDWRRAQRKLACVLMLSDPDEYEGGDVSYFDGRERVVKRLDKGAAYVMPSFIQHRVAPVTRGERRVLIGWLCGPRFR